ncbi:MAG TPA: response regulator [Trichocoleus sp.]
MSTVVVVEDEFQILSNLEEILTLSGHTVMAAGDGVQGLKLIQTHCPDVVVCDVMMPGMDGYSILEAMRQNPATAEIPLILLTARAERGDHRRGMELGANDYVTKPFTTEELLKAIDVQLAKRAALAQKIHQIQDRLGESRRQAEDYRQQEQQSRELALLKDELLKKLLEDLSNPVSNINLAIRMLESASTASQRQQYLQVLRQECNREMQMLNEIAELQTLLTPEKAAILRRFNLLKTIS